MCLSRGSKVSARMNGWFPKTAQHGQCLHSLFAIHKLFKIQFFYVFIQAKLRRLQENERVQTLSLNYNLKSKLQFKNFLVQASALN